MNIEVIKDRFYRAFKKRDMLMTEARVEIGISYPTLLRFLGDEKINFTTLIKIDKWADKILGDNK